jgi:hypothetical protein
MSDQAAKACIPGVEPWLRGPIEGVEPAAGALILSFQQVREDLRQHVGDLTPVQVWAAPPGMAPAGFHIRHAGGAADRLCAYLEGRSLSDEQKAAARREAEPGASFEELIAELSARLERVENVVRGITAAQMNDARAVGAKQLPTTVIGLIVHIAEHTQRHLGQAITTAKLARATAA